MSCRGSISVVVVVCLASACAGDNEPVEPGTRAAVTTLSATFRTEVSNHYLAAENGGGGLVNADRTAAQAWETFTLVDENGEALVSGDIVLLRAANGSYLQAANGGGTTVNAASANALDWERFRIVRRAGGGVVSHDDVVGLQTLVSGRWLSALQGGGAGVDAHGTAFAAWEGFRIGLGGGGGPPPGGWNLVWRDEFDGTSIDESKWAYEVRGPGWVNNELQNYTNRRWENARVEGGHLVIEGRRDWFQGHEYSSARLKTQGRASWRYGRVEARVQVPGGRGTWPAFWMMPDNFSRGWPACGEIDILEHVGYDPNRVHATLHSKAYNWQSPEQRTATTWVDGAVSGYHVYALEWSADRIEMFVDGRSYFLMNNPHWGDDWWPFDKNFYVILNLAIGGTWGGAQGVDPNIWPEQMLVDYVRVYQR